MSGIVTDLADLFPDTASAQAGTMNAFGEWTASGDAISFSCRISTRNRKFRDSSGTEVVSSAQIIAAGAYGLDARTHRFNLPGRFDPSDEIEALAVVPVTDESGLCYEKVVLP